jgi:hypothetical protein
MERQQLVQTKGLRFFSNEWLFTSNEWLPPSWLQYAFRLFALVVVFDTTVAIVVARKPMHTNGGAPSLLL